MSDYSLDAHLMDMDTVVTRLELQQFALLALVHPVPAAIKYSVRWPERVSRLVLIRGYARG
jgi:hypothetical protein